MSTSIARNLRNLRYALLPAHQPPHAGEIEDADPQPVPHAVVRHAVPALAVDHVDIDHVEAVAPHQRRQETMQPVEIRQREKQVAAKRLEPAAGVARAVAQDRAAHAVGDARLQLLEAARLAPGALAGREPDPRAALPE